MFQAKEVWGAPSSWPSRSWRGTTSASSAPSARSPWWARASYREGGGYTEQGKLINLLRYFCTYWLPLYRSWSSCYSLFLALEIFRQASPVLMLKHLIFRVLECWCWSTWEIYFTLFLRFVQPKVSVLPNVMLNNRLTHYADENLGCKNWNINRYVCPITLPLN